MKNVSKLAVSLLIALVSFIPALAAGAASLKPIGNTDTTEIAEAKRSFDLTRSPEQIISSLKPQMFPAMPQAERSLLNAELFPEIKPHVLRQGEEADRLSRLAQTVFDLHGCTSCAAILYRGDKPFVTTWKLNFVLVSTGMINLLTDDELIGVIGHEVGHLYFVEDLKRATAASDARIFRVMELKCDIVGVMTLRALGRRCGAFKSALEKIKTDAEKRKLAPETSQSFPVINTRILSAELVSSALR